MKRPEADLCGVDVGLSFADDSSGICRTGSSGFAVAHTFADKLSRAAALAPVSRFHVVAIDGPVLPAGELDYDRRTCEYVFVLPPFNARCPPGLSEHGMGAALRRGGCDTAAQFHSLTSSEPCAAVFPRVHEGKNIVEAFPNAFMGVMLKDETFGAMPDLKRGEKSDWLYDECLDARRFDALHELLGWEDAEFWAGIPPNRNHDGRAALVCGLTAIAVYTGKYVAVGEPTLGYFFLPPWDVWRNWAKEGLDQARRDDRVDPGVEVWINGSRYGRKDALGEAGRGRATPTRLLWRRCSQKDDEYALEVANPSDVDRVGLKNLFARVKTATGGRGRGLAKVAQRALDRWLENPSSPLPSQAYALVSNWFLTEAEIDRESALGLLCGDFWDALFAVRPPKRMAPVDGNDSIQDLPFEVWWRKMLASGGAVQ